MNILLLLGKAESGKDEASKFIQADIQRHNYSPVWVVHFADYLKYILRSYYMWNGKKDEAGRSLLQNVGAEIRSIDPTFFAEMLAKTVYVTFQRNSTIIIPDTRYKNEIETMQNLVDRLNKEVKKDLHHDLITVRVVREDHINSLTPEQRLHHSETELDNYICNLTISNYSDLGRLKLESEDVVSNMWRWGAFT